MTNDFVPQPITRDPRGRVYVAVLDGFCKVGETGRWPEYRFAELRATAERWWSEPHEDYKVSERKLLRRLGELGHHPIRGREYFAPEVFEVAKHEMVRMFVEPDA